MRYSSIDNFPALRDFCNNNYIMFKLYVHSDGIREFIFDKPFYPKYTYAIPESDLGSLYIRGFERELINNLKNHFCIKGDINSSPMDQAVRYCENDVKVTQEFYEILMKEKKMRPRLRIKNVIFNDPATIVFWYDGTKTVVKCQEGDTFDPEKGLAMAICKKILGSNDSQSNFNDIFKKWLPKEGEKKEPKVIGKIKNMRMTEAGLVVNAEITDAEFAPRINEILGILGE